MRKNIILTILLSCLHIAARGQTIASLDDIDLSGLPQPTTAKALRYWFDDDGGSVKTVNQLKGKQTLDVSALIDGLHTVHYQVIDENNGVANVQSSLFMKVNGMAINFTSKQLRYWFDDDASTLKTITATNGMKSLDASQLLDGLHTIHYQVLGSDNTVYHVASALFMKMSSGNNATAKQLRYWFDDDATTLKTITATNGQKTLDASQLLDGLHTIHYQVVGSDNTVYHVASALFMKMGSGNNVTAKKLRYWFDDDASTLKTITATNGLKTLDASQLLDGLHTIHYQVVGSDNTVYHVASALFMKMDIKAKPNIACLQYWFDEDHANARQTELSDVMIVDASELPEGLHSLHYQLVADDGQVFPIASGIFDRWLYDIYVSEWTEYADSTVSSNPLFAGKPSLKLHYKNDDLNVRGHLTVDEGTTISLGKYVQTANWGTQHNNMYAKTGDDYYHPTTLLNMGGFMRADSVMVKQDLYRDRWHFISLPFTANVSDIDAPEDTYWALRSYDGEARAAGLMSETWRNMRSGEQMEAGRGYIVQLTKAGEEKTSRLTFKAINDTKKNNIFTTDDVTLPLEEHQAEFAHNRSWNLVGNPYPAFYDSRSIDLAGNIIVWNGNGYSAYSLTDDSYVLMPFEAFFVQRPVDNDALSFSKDGRQHTNEVLPRASARRQAKALQNRRVLNFVLSDAEGVDRSRVVVNEQASMGYEQDKDAPKFMEERPQTAQLFSVDGGVQYAINERPMGDGQIVFSLYAPADGEYRFSLVSNATERYNDITLLDTETGSIWNCADGEYVFTATEGMHNARLVVSLTGEATAIAQVSAYDDGEIKVANGQLTFRFMRDKNIKVFSPDGRILFNDAANHATVMVSHGVYLIDIDGKTTKIMVK